MRVSTGGSSTLVPSAPRDGFDQMADGGPEPALRLACRRCSGQARNNGWKRPLRAGRSGPVRRARQMDSLNAGVTSEQLICRRTNPENLYNQQFFPFVIRMYDAPRPSFYSLRHQSGRRNELPEKKRDSENPQLYPCIVRIDVVLSATGRGGRSRPSELPLNNTP
jgi:hypothetical protein